MFPIPAPLVCSSQEKEKKQQHQHRRPKQRHPKTSNSYLQRRFVWVSDQRMHTHIISRARWESHLNREGRRHKLSQEIARKSEESKCWSTTWATAMRATKFYWVEDQGRETAASPSTISFSSSLRILYGATAPNRLKNLPWHCLKVLHVEIQVGSFAVLNN